MRITFVLFLLILMSCQTSDLKQNQNVKLDLYISEDKFIQDTTEIIPQIVLDYIKDSLPGWEIPDTSEYIKPWWFFYDMDQITYYITTDLNNDQISDYAFTLKNEGSIRLVFILSYGNKLTHLIADDFNERYEGKGLKYGILIEPPGRTDRVVDGKEVSLSLKLNGVALMREEIMIRVYYWDKEKMKMFKTR